MTDDFEQAKCDPGRAFNSPDDILNHKTLSKHKKIELLRIWAYDEHQKQVADEENMPATQENGTLQKISKALHQLGETLDLNSPPTK